MKEISKNELQEWCSDYCNCYSVWIDGCLMNTGPCPFLCDEIADSIGRSSVFEDVTKRAGLLDRQLQYEVEHNDCKLFMIHDGDRRIVISYFNHTEG